MRILAFAASNSSQSINKKLIAYSASILKNHQVEILDLNNYEMPIYSFDRESQSGTPQPAKDFHQKIGSADALLISFAEHNGLYSAAFKNIFDWVSRHDKSLYQNKPIVMLATSPGKGGAARVLELAKDAAPHFAGKVIGTFSLPNFNENFDNSNNMISNIEYDNQLRNLLINSFNY